MPSSRPSPPAPRLPHIRERILVQARVHFFAHGYSSFTMDDLAAELGMSKKTIYVQFAGKDEIIGAIIHDIGEETRSNSEAILRQRELDFIGKLHAFVESVMQRLATLEQRTLRDLQRHAPGLFARIDEMRRKVIPSIFSRLLEEGRAEGFVRRDASRDFAIEFFLHAMQGILQGPALEHLHVTPREAIAQGIDLFFSGLLTPAGRKQHEKLFPH